MVGRFTSYVAHNLLRHQEAPLIKAGGKAPLFQIYILSCCVARLWCADPERTFDDSGGPFLFSPHPLTFLPFPVPQFSFKSFFLELFSEASAALRLPLKTALIKAFHSGHRCNNTLPPS